jgi:hypothetical protein
MELFIKNQQRGHFFKVLIGTVNYSRDEKNAFSLIRRDGGAACLF